MITLDKTYYIKSDQYQWILCHKKKKGAVPKGFKPKKVIEDSEDSEDKTTEYLEEQIAWSSDLSKILNKYFDIKYKKKIRSKNFSLKEALVIRKNLIQETRELFKDIFDLPECVDTDTKDLIKGLKPTKE